MFWKFSTFYDLIVYLHALYRITNLFNVRPYAYISNNTPMYYKSNIE